jgi:hypothetical protein
MWFNKNTERRVLEDRAKVTEQKLMGRKIDYVARKIIVQLTRDIPEFIPFTEYHKEREPEEIGMIFGKKIILKPLWEKG